jgi:hypothetical protein
MEASAFAAILRGSPFGLAPQDDGGAGGEVNFRDHALHRNSFVDAADGS